jgi:hypothetical protein
MWKVLGTETVLLKAGDVWEERLLELSTRKKDAPKFRDILAKAEITYWFDAIREIHTFFLRFPTKTKTDDMAFVRDYILKLHKVAKVPVIEFRDEPQKFTVVLTAEKEVEAHKGRNAWWEKYEKEEKTQTI